MFRSSSQQISYFLAPIKITHHLNYPLWELEDVLYPLFQKSFTYGDLRETIRNANHIWCAHENDICVGCALMFNIGSSGGLLITLFGVRKSAQGRGIGTSLLKNIIAWYHRRGYKYIHLQTERTNKKAIRMYEKAGFILGIGQSNYMKDLPETGYDSVPMTLFFI